VDRGDAGGGQRGLEMSHAPSHTPSVTRDRMLFSSLDMPPDLLTYATLPGWYSLHATTLSSMPPVLPIRKQPISGGNSTHVHSQSEHG
jgi:hypothetical protein